MSLDQDDDFVGKQALLKIREECANRRLVVWRSPANLYKAAMNTSGKF